MLRLLSGKNTDWPQQRNPFKAIFESALVTIKLAFYCGRLITTLEPIIYLLELQSIPYLDTKKPYKNIIIDKNSLTFSLH